DSNGGDIGQSGALTVAGTSMLDAGGGAITLEDSDNDFVGSVRLTGGAVSIADRNMLTLGPVDASSLEADAAVIAMTGDVTTSGDQAYHGAIWLAGNLLLQSASGDITFNSTVDGPFALDASAAGGA